MKVSRSRKKVDSRDMKTKTKRERKKESEGREGSREGQSVLVIRGEMNVLVAHRRML